MSSVRVISGSAYSHTQKELQDRMDDSMLQHLRKKMVYLRPEEDCAAQDDTPHVPHG